MLCSIATSCGIMGTVTRESQYAKMYEEKPITLLVMPPINNSNSVEAKDLLYTSISRPLIEAGYYVISPLLAMDVLKEESAYDSELFFEAPLTTFQNYFGADAVVFSVIDVWTKKGLGILYLDLSVDSGNNSLLGALIDLAASAINTAATDHIKAARMANYYIFRDIPRGKYNPEYMLDKQTAAETKDIVTSVK